ncbi:MAG: OadG family protein [Proteobacteria bacterium]|nr:OadG family protein [Pseudomonadota bacterium]MBU1688106.1 OadG family protein [Pseudomonadota bacterium]
MNFLSKISFDNLFSADLNAISLSIIGMSIVFAGLSIISIYVALLPKILAIPGKIRKRRFAAKTTLPAGDNPTEAEVMLAIGLALHLDSFSSGENLRITWNRADEGVSSWQAAGRIRGTAVRSHLPRRR